MVYDIVLIWLCFDLQLVEEFLRVKRFMLYASSRVISGAEHWLVACFRHSVLRCDWPLELLMSFDVVPVQLFTRSIER